MSTLPITTYAKTHGFRVHEKNSVHKTSRKYLEKTAGDSVAERLKQLVAWMQENPEISGAVGGGVGGASLGALISRKGQKGKGALIGGTAGAGLGGVAGHYYGKLKNTNAKNQSEDKTFKKTDSTGQSEHEDTTMSGTSWDSATHPEPPEDMSGRRPTPALRSAINAIAPTQAPPPPNIREYLLPKSSATSRRTLLDDMREKHRGPSTFNPRAVRELMNAILEQDESYRQQ